MFNLQEYVSEYVRVLRRLDGSSVERMAEAIVGAWLSGRTVFICGNGGSASSASHVATDLTKLTAPARGPRLRAMALNESASTISAVGNDISYDQIFAEQLRTFCQANDVVIGFSTSGASPNVLRAIEYANSVGATTLGVTGRTGAPLQRVARHCVVVDSTSVQHTEDATMVVGHVLCLRVKEALQVVHGQSELWSSAPAQAPHLNATAVVSEATA
jgi:D-sedoheptulose 7-phosphate isomerase